MDARSLTFAKLSFPVQPLRHGVAHYAIVIGKDGIHRQTPGIVGSDAKNVHERNGFFVRLTHGIGGLLFETINSPDPRHDSVTNVHEHTGGEEKGPDSEEGHESDQVYHNGMKDAEFVGAKEVVPTEQSEGKGGGGPGV